MKISTDPEYATSERCLNRNTAKVTDILWLHHNQRGCCLRPHQMLHIRPWLSFPNRESSLMPFARESTPEQFLEKLALDRDNVIHLLLETDLEPNIDKNRIADNVKVRKICLTLRSSKSDVNID